MKKIRNIYSDLLKNIQHGQISVLETTFNGKTGDVISDMERHITVLPLSATMEDERCTTITSVKSDGRNVIKEPIYPPERMIILGGGHIARPVCEFSAKIGFSVTVCDDRPDFANRSRFPLAMNVICDSFQNAIRSLHITPYDYVIVITRGHRYDAECLRILLSGNMPAYLGMIGSKRRGKGILEMLCEEGYSEKRLSEICTPIGFSIGAVTPEEIAISILAEVIAYKRLPEYQKKTGYRNNTSDLDLEVISYLADSREQKAIVTVIETKGSTPRTVGAKMVVSPIGQVVGSIGGGCSESEVILEAIRIIGTQTYKIHEIDLTGDVAESEDMVCGGIMRVLIEDYV